MSESGDGTATTCMPSTVAPRIELESTTKPSPSRFRSVTTLLNSTPGGTIPTWNIVAFDSSDPDTFALTLSFAVWLIASPFSGDTPSTMTFRFA